MTGETATIGLIALGVVTVTTMLLLVYLCRVRGVGRGYFVLPILALLHWSIFAFAASWFRTHVYADLPSGFVTGWSIIVQGHVAFTGLILVMLLFFTGDDGEQ